MIRWERKKWRNELGEKLTVESHPPASPLVANEAVEQDANDAPGEVVERRRGRDVARPGEDDGGVKEAHPGLWPLALDQPEDDGERGAGDPKVFLVGGMSVSVAFL